MAQIDDGIGDIRAQLREDMGKHHAEVQNTMLVMPLENYDPATAYTTLNAMGRNYTSLMKVVASEDELDALASASLISSATATEISHIYGTNRDDNSFLDATVSFGSGYASGDARSLTLTVINSLLREI